MNCHGLAELYTERGWLDPTETSSRRQPVPGWQEERIGQNKVTCSAKLNQGKLAFGQARACKVSKTWSFSEVTHPSMHLLLIPSIEIPWLHDTFLHVLAIREWFVSARGHLRNVNLALLPHLRPGPIQVPEQVLYWSSSGPVPDQSEPIVP